METNASASSKFTTGGSFDMTRTASSGDFDRQPSIVSGENFGQSEYEQSNQSQSEWKKIHIYKVQLFQSISWKLFFFGISTPL